LHLKLNESHHTGTSEEYYKLSLYHCKLLPYQPTASHADGNVKQREREREAEKSTLTPKRSTVTMVKTFMLIRRLF